MTNTKNTQFLSSAQTLARLNQALVDSGLDKSFSEREPVPLFRQLLNEFYLEQGLSLPITDESATLVGLTAVLGLAQLQNNIKQRYTETLNLTSAHGTLNAWSRRELDQELQRLQEQINRGNRGIMSSF